MLSLLIVGTKKLESGEFWIERDREREREREGERWRGREREREGEREARNQRKSLVV